MLKIIKPGKPQPVVVFRGTCFRCGCEMEAPSRDHTMGNGETVTVPDFGGPPPQPVCGSRFDPLSRSWLFWCDCLNCGQHGVALNRTTVAPKEKPT